MAKQATTLTRESTYFDEFLRRLGQPSGDPHSTTMVRRCWTEGALKGVIRSIQADLAKDGFKKGSQSPQSLLATIVRQGHAAKLPIDGESFYLLELGARPEAEVDPLELLMSAKPAGVICYFSAVVYHSLTTQVAAHHHVAELTPPREVVPKVATKTTPKDPEAEPIAPSERPPRSLGTLLFRYHDLPYYLTRRSSRLIPGVQVRHHGPRTRIRITTLEQTLLDTLYKPFQSGGPEVVFEVWQTATDLGRIDEERLVQYLVAMNYPATTRRLAVMLELVEHAPGAELARLLDRCQAEMDRESPFARISLLPGLSYESLNERWLVKTP